LLARPTLEILKNIRDEARGTNERLEVLTGRVDALTDRVEQVHQRQVDAELRVATALTALAGTVDGLREDLREDRILRRQVYDHEQRITALEART
jgi:hypothetical protein